MTRDARAVAASLTAALLVSLWVCRDSMRLLSVPGLVLLAVGYVAIATVVAALVFVLAHGLFGGGHRVCFRHVFFAAVAPAALMPGTALLISRHSFWSAVPAAAIGWIVASGLRTHASARKDLGFQHYLVSPPMPSGWTVRLAMALLAGLLVEGTAACVAAHERTLAAVFAAATAVTIAEAPGAVEQLKRTNRCLEWRGTQRKWALVIANAFTITCFALFPHVWSKRWPTLDLPDGSGSTDERSTENEQSRTRVANSNIPLDPDVHQGIIIYPEEEKHIRLVPPMPTVRAAAAGRAANPLTIPFFGVYWVFRPPNRRPPPTSLVLRADPAKRNLHSNDGRTLNMEARQNFGTYFDPACCVAIAVNTVSNDSQPDTIKIELFVRDSADPKAAPAFVGSEPLPDEQGGTIRFPFPPHLRRFDEVIINYKLSLWRRDRAPKVAIKSFVFEPR